MPITRRGFLGTPLAALAPAALLGTAPEYHFHHDHVLGTSLDLVLSGHALSQDEASAAETAMFAEVNRLTRILNTRDPQSDISRGVSSRELTEVLAAYEEWHTRTSGAISSRLGGKLNVDALGKSYIIDRAIRAATSAAPHAEGSLLNIGGDIVVRGRSPRTIGVAHPAGADNSEPLTHIRIADGAAATSGTSERGAHIVDPRTGSPVTGARNVTVVAPDSVTANALATACCVLSHDQGIALVDRTPGAAALVIAPNGATLRSARFGAVERATIRTIGSAADWPTGFELAVTVTLKEIQGFRVHRPYLAVWAEDSSGRLVRSIAVWASKPRWMAELHTWWSQAGGRESLFSITKPTRPPGKYRIVWDGLDDAGHPVPEGTFHIAVETNREHGDYAKVTGTIECGAKPARIGMKETGEFEPVVVDYGPRAQNA